MKTRFRILALYVIPLFLAASPAPAAPLDEHIPPPPPPVQPLPELPHPGDGRDSPPPDQALPPPREVSPPPATPDLCQAFYQGRFTRHNDSATLAIQGGDFVLHGNGQDYHGLGTCDATSETGARFHFTLDDDARYVFRGVIQIRSDGSAIVNADEVKAGVVIDHLLLSGVGN